MTVEIGILFTVLAAMAYIFVTEKLPVDLTAFLGLLFLILARFITPEEAFSGFASPAVITMLSIFFVSGALSRTGVADVVGGWVNRWAGANEILLLVTIMLISAALSAFMNNIAATAMLLPAVSSISRKSGVSPSRLFLPLAFGAILGGMLTLVGTPPNILTSEMLRGRGLAPFGLFDFTPLGLVLLACGILYMAIAGKWLLPVRDTGSTASPYRDLARTYELNENLFSIRIPIRSQLDGKTLSESKLGTTLGVQIVGIVRGGRKRLAPDGSTVLMGGDQLLAKGSYSDLEELIRVRGVEIEEVTATSDLSKAADRLAGFTAVILPGSPLADRTLRGIGFRGALGAVVVGIRRDGQLVDMELADRRLLEGDELLILAPPRQVASIIRRGDLEVSAGGPPTFRDLEGHIFLLRVPGTSELAGRTIGESRMGELTGLNIAGVLRGGDVFLAIDPKETIRPNDELLVIGDPDRIRRLIHLGNVKLGQDVTESVIQSDDNGLVEAAIAPRSNTAGKTLSELRFADRYGLQVLALWREGRPIHSGLARIPLRFGDALLLQGPWTKISIFGASPDFVTLSQRAQAPRRYKKAPYAVGGLLLMILMVATGWQPVHVASFAAAVLVAASGAITMQEAYRTVEWRALFLVAAILPVGIAMERTGGAMLLSSTVIELAGPYGPYAVLAGLIFLSSLLSQALDGAPTVVLLTPVALQAAQRMGISPHTVMMGIGLAASVAFMTPFSAKAGLLVMGAGGYRATDYLKIGTPLTVLLLVLLVILVPVFFPFHP